MADTIIDGTLFNAQNIKYSAPKANAVGGKSVNILNKSTNSGIRLSTPLMLTWGASDFQDKETGLGNGKFEMALQFPTDEYKNDDTAAFLKNLMAFEDKVKADALTYSKEWFGKVHKSEEVINALWVPILRYSKDKETGEADLNKAPTIRVKIPIWEKVWRCEIYDEDGETLFPNITNPAVSPLDFLQKGSNLALVMQCGGIWFANGKFGVTWKLIQAVVQKPKTSLTGQCFIKLKASDKEKLKTATPPVEEADAEAPGALVEDTDDEEEEDTEPAKASEPEPEPEPVAESKPEPEPVAEPAAAPKKKVVKKKATA